MEQILLTIGIYAFLMIVFRISGKRTLKDVTVFDFILLRTLSERGQHGRRVPHHRAPWLHSHHPRRELTDRPPSFPAASLDFYWV